MADEAEGVRVVRRSRRSREIRAAKWGGAADAIGELGPGAELYVLTFGQFSLIDVLEAVLMQTGPAEVDIATWTVAADHIGAVEALINRSAISRFRLVVDRSFINRQPAYCARMREAFGDERIRTTSTHAKFVALRNAEWSIAIRSSMNLNANRRLENLEISVDAELCEFLRLVVDDLFAEHRAGDFGADLPDLDSVTNVDVPGMLSGLVRASATAVRGLGRASRGPA